LDSPTSGEVYVGGKRIDQMSEKQRAILRRDQIGFVFQAFNLIGNLSVLDNVELPALIGGVIAGQTRQRQGELLSRLGISEKARNVPAQLSGGEKQRVALARALINQPVVLLADEPTGNLDSKSAFEVMRLLRQTHDQGQTVLVVTHDPNVASIAQRVIFMRDGQITHETILEGEHDSQSLLKEMLVMEA
jgi:putative ABC transport system ATP-binding protein